MNSALVPNARSAGPSMVRIKETSTKMNVCLCFHPFDYSQVNLTSPVEQKVLHVASLPSFTTSIPDEYTS